MDKEVQKTINEQDAPKSWSGRCTDIISDGEIEACGVCGRLPDAKTGDDACMVSLGKVINACCGHGVSEGYIMFDDNRIIHGLFTIDKVESSGEELTAREHYKKRITEMERKLKFYTKELEKFKKLHDKYEPCEYLFE